MPFGLANAPTVFQCFINSVLHNMLDDNLLNYLDDMLVATKTKESNIRVIRKVLWHFRVNSLSALPPPQQSSNNSSIPFSTPYLMTTCSTTLMTPSQPQKRRRPISESFTKSYVASEQMDSTVTQRSASSLSSSPNGLASSSVAKGSLWTSTRFRQSWNGQRLPESRTSRASWDSPTSSVIL